MPSGFLTLRCAGKWEAVGSDPLLAQDAKARKEKLLREVEVGIGVAPEVVERPKTLEEFRDAFLHDKRTTSRRTGHL